MNKPKKQERLEEWLGGLSLVEKITSIEKGKLLRCVICGKRFFDQETPKERKEKKCKSVKLNHECIETGNYLILRRGFVGITDAICCKEGESVEDLIIDYFNRRR